MLVCIYQTAWCHVRTDNIDNSSVYLSHLHGDEMEQTCMIWWGAEFKTVSLTNIILYGWTQGGIHNRWSSLSMYLTLVQDAPSTGNSQVVKQLSVLIQGGSIKTVTFRRQLHGGNACVCQLMHDKEDWCMHSEERGIFSGCFVNTHLCFVFSKI
jgi:hypothetical protein